MAEYVRVGRTIMVRRANGRLRRPRWTRRGHWHFLRHIGSKRICNHW